MLGRNDLRTLEAILNREKDLILKYENCLHQLKEPQMRSDIQSLLAQHRNQYNTMLSILEDTRS